MNYFAEKTYHFLEMNVKNIISNLKLVSPKSVLHKINKPPPPHTHFNRMQHFKFQRSFKIQKKNLRSVNERFFVR